MGTNAGFEDASMPLGGARHIPETELLWTETEGQVVNAGVFIFAALTCWLIIPVFYAIFRYLRSLNKRYTLTDQRLLVRTGIIVKHEESLELYRVIDLTVSSTLAQTIFRRGRVILRSTDASTPELIINAIANPSDVARLIRNTVESCRVLKGVRAFDH